MKVRDLLDEIKRCQKEYGKDFLEWDVYTEQLTTQDKKHKRGSGNSWETAKDADGWEYFRCCGFWTLMPKEKIFTINVNF